MEYIKDLTNYESKEKCVVTLGKFDGVHRGHRKLISRVRAMARRQKCRAAVFTFDVAPQIRLGERKKQMLMTNAERSAFLHDCSIDLLVECPFTPEIRGMEPEQFVTEILLKKLHVSGVVAGTDYRFGKDRAGTAFFLQEMGEKYGFSVEIIEKEMDGDREISSTYIREELAAGHVAKVRELLGYPYFVTGEVVHGRHLGHSLGFPTLNQIPDPSKMLPPNGVYFSLTEVAGKTYQGISNIGYKPTVGSEVLGIETYLFDCSLDLYGQMAKVELLEFRRPEKKFAGIDELKNQMDEDIQAADRYFLTV
ncbi:MAG: bifunctional riboflavin kinase/FAD synthetase [Eubacterium sp.]|nr:bifunctional riboflavin kinase/FAD synthetase [Eubacterium sp.]